ncbi:sulfhydryl oxidase 1-like [Lingula anatina]|uniref:Sulfhydryl oxidase n=1 Tax=Lingula anatina TaxID=7574 RepID=A0A1S3HU54_LINAN|nr:sulfhydryl oxidase 1-like [Lingula anatina]|eukprot:XP_013389572.1 sulfhydryl oxidase 1-like [Lingula anatina]
MSEVILSVLPYREKIIVRRMLKQDMRKIQVDSLPALVHLDKTGSYSELALGETKSLVFIRELYNLAGIDEEEEEGEVQKDDGSLLLIDAGLRVYMQDLESTLHYSFRKEICNFKVVKGEDLAALKSYVSVLSKYFPGQPHVVKYLWSLNKWMQSVSGQVTDKEWEAKVKELKTKDAYLPEVTKWVACQGSAEKYRGYPCGLWTLFHVLSVQAVDVNLDRK